MMIYTCTMNLAIDLFIKTPQMLPSEAVSYTHLTLPTNREV